MNINEFRELLETELNGRLKENERLHFSNVRKNNGLILTGVSVFNGSKKITPTVYIEEYFRHYNDGMGIGEIADQILKLCRKRGIGVRFDVDGFIDFEKAKDRIVFKLINTEKNEELLREIPAIPFLDLSMVFYYLLGEKKSCRASILIRNEHAKNWGVTTAQLYEAAKKNLPMLLPVETIDMKSMMQDLLKEQLKDIGRSSEDLEEIMESVHLTDDDKDRISMYVMTNKDKYYGAAGIACAEAIRQAADQLGGDLYVLPSSVHEVILLPVSEDIDPKTLGEMVKDVNQTQLSPDEVLSDSVYRYSREKMDFEIVSAQT